jgi:hypothetical protein
MGKRGNESGWTTQAQLHARHGCTSLSLTRRNLRAARSVPVAPPLRFEKTIADQKKSS